MARQEPLTEREVREALGLSHRAASLALAEAESWGIVERVPEPRRVGRRGPAGTAYLAVGDHWQWFGRVIAERKVREGDPIVAVLEAKEREAAVALADHPDDVELAALREWLSAVPRLRPPLRSRRRTRPAARAARARALPAAPRSGPRLDDPPPVRPARRPRGRRRHRPDRRPVPAVADGGAARDQADVRGGQDRRPLDHRTSPDRTIRKPAPPCTTSQRFRRQRRLCDQQLRRPGDTFRWQRQRHPQPGPVTQGTPTTLTATWSRARSRDALVRR